MSFSKLYGLVVFNIRGVAEFVLLGPNTGIILSECGCESKKIIKNKVKFC